MTAASCMIAAVHTWCMWGLLAIAIMQADGGVTALASLMIQQLQQLLQDGLLPGDVHHKPSMDHGRMVHHYSLGVLLKPRAHLQHTHTRLICSSRSAVPDRLITALHDCNSDRKVQQACMGYCYTACDGYTLRTPHHLINQVALFNWQRVMPSITPMLLASLNQPSLAFDAAIQGHSSARPAVSCFCSRQAQQWHTY